ncbi:AlkA N-terminal domain-containing protein [Amnibacterium sp. CER49]|uniref:DNA-3-methyladenine glycosylase family protein n=1 Tax=Amnibacterium sp. CER49 TaxID=3039161 RepID=UPI0024499B63|nr:AlkA N-terminal domain-containing protein [Amnibacterium sp. CER49]MDH2444987.1 AlkA N-terminal domain-containing protein [Amnibacterium sp. CER49]
MRLRRAVRLPFVPPLLPDNLYGHLAATAVPGVEEWRDGAYRAAVALPHGPAILTAGLPDGDAVPAVLLLSDERDEPEALRRIRQLLDLDRDPGTADDLLARDPALAPLVAAAPGRRVPGSPDAPSMVLKAVLGQQVSTAAARTHAGRLAEALGTPVVDPEGRLSRLFPAPRALAEQPERAAEALRMPASRRGTVLGVAAALAAGRVDLTDPAGARQSLLALPGVGPWTVETVAMRALGDLDAFPASDLGVLAAVRRLGLPDGGRALLAHARGWSPMRAVAVQHLWATGEHPVNALPR